MKKGSIIDKSICHHWSFIIIKPTYSQFSFLYTHLQVHCKIFDVLEV